MLEQKFDILDKENKISKHLFAKTSNDSSNSNYFERNMSTSCYDNFGYKNSRNVNSRQFSERPKTIRNFESSKTLKITCENNNLDFYNRSQMETDYEANSDKLSFNLDNQSLTSLFSLNRNINNIRGTTSLLYKFFIYSF